MKGFFYEKKTKDKPVKKQPGKKDIPPCEACGLHETCITPKMKPSGKGKKKILILAEAPGKNEDEKGTQLIGEAGKTLRNILNNIGVDLDRDCWKTNAVNCRPPKNRKPTTREINCCRSNLFSTIKEFKPEKIITLGQPALEALIGEKISIGAVEKWVGWKIPDQDLKCWIFPNYHPQFLNYNKDDKVLRDIFINSLSGAVNWSEEFPKDEIKINYLNNPFEAIIFLESLLTFKTPITFDIETTGKRYHNTEQKIICASIATSSTTAHVFPIFDDKPFLFALKRVLKSNISKIGQNIKFENMWCKNKLKCNISKWIWDTMIISHCMDNRTGTTGLKFQTYVNFGVSGYNKQVEDSIEIKEEFGFNKLSELPLKTVMEYCAKDTIYDYRLFLKQNPIKEMIPGIDLFTEGQRVFSEIEQNGICIDIDYYKNIYDVIEKKQRILNKKIQASPELKNWNGEFNFNSSKQLNQLLFKDLKYKPDKKTPTDNNSTDAEVLDKINTEFTKRILQHRKLEKIKGTYIKGFIENSFEGKIYPGFNLNLVKSHRSSSDSPNFQNIPVRDAQAQEYTRSGIKPTFGNQLLEVDYGSMEVRISVCYHHDPVMMEYVNNPDTDMHRDQAREIFCKKDINKHQRYLAKNKFVFPQFYGDYFVNCAKNIWKEAEEEELPEMSYNQFENHMKKVENNFNNKFKGYKKWKDKIWNDFQNKNKLYLHSGFVIQGHLKRKEVLNYSIQGTAFHCLLWSLIQLHHYLKDNNYKTKIIGQIHDSIIFDLCPNEKKKLFPIIRKVMTEDIREYWKWIVVPLDVEAKISGINGNWFQMKEEKI